jgi:hypothetical protein
MVVRRIADATGIKGEVSGMLIGTPGRPRAQELGRRRGGVPAERPWKGGVLDPVARQARGTEQAGDPDNGGAASLGEPAGGGDGRERAWFLPAEIPSCESTGAWSDELCRVTAAVFAISFF